MFSSDFRVSSINILPVFLLDDLSLTDLEIFFISFGYLSVNNISFRFVEVLLSKVQFLL